MLASTDYSYDPKRDLVTAVENKRVASTAETISQYAYAYGYDGLRTSCTKTKPEGDEHEND